MPKDSAVTIDSVCRVPVLTVSPERYVLVIGGLPFYRSSGLNSGLPQVWLPFLGAEHDADGVWFIKLYSVLNMKLNTHDSHPGTSRNLFIYKHKRFTQLIEEINTNPTLAKTSDKCEDFEQLTISLVCSELAAISASLTIHSTAPENNFWLTDFGQELSNRLQKLHPHYFLKNFSLLEAHRSQQAIKLDEHDAIIAETNKFINENDGVIFDKQLATYWERLISFNSATALQNGEQFACKLLKPEPQLPTKMIFQKIFWHTLTSIDAQYKASRNKATEITEQALAKAKKMELTP